MSRLPLTANAWTACRHADVSSRAAQEPDWRAAELLHEFAAGSIPGVLACIHFALRDRPGTIILTAPVRPAQMHEKLLQFRTDASGCLRSTLVGGLNSTGFLLASHTLEGDR